jgi:hypothetical protein
MTWLETLQWLVLIVYLAWQWRNQAFRRGYEIACCQVWDLALEDRFKSARDLRFVPRSTEDIARQLLAESSEDL